MNVILSIKPFFVEKIFSGEKKYEYRKQGFGQNVNKIYIYATSPICRIVGEFVLDGIIKDTPENVWSRTKMYSGLTKEFYDNYYKDRRLSYALKISSLIKYSEEINPNDIIDNFIAPQSFRYIKNELK